MKNKLLPFVFLLTTLFAACKKENDLPIVSIGKEYQPFVSGAAFVYQVDSIVYDDFNQRVDTYSYQVKEVFKDTIFNSEQVRILDIYKWAEDKWIIDQRWQAERSNRHFIRVENNEHKLRLIFPVREGESWDLNAKNDKSRRIFKYENLHQAFQTEQIIYPHTITTSFNFFDTILTKYNEKQVYARDIGLVHHYFEYIDLQKDSGLVFIKNLKQFNLES